MHIKRTHQSSHVILIAAVAALSGLLFGYDTGVISGAILFINNAFHLTAAMNSFVVSSVLMGACSGALISGKLTDFFGRKIMLIADAILFIIGTLIAACANDIEILVVGRVIVGIAIGIASFTAPLYISEIAPKELRGALVSMNQLAVATGIFISYLVDYYFSHQAAWRWMFGVGVVPAIILLTGLFFLPYSPRWLIKKGKSQQALFILNQIRLNTISADSEYAEIQNSIQHKKSTWRELFSLKIRKTVVIGVGLAFIQQFTGINTILYYAPTIFQRFGFHEASTAILASVSIGVVFLIFTAVGLLLMDKVGRKPLLYVGVTIMALALLLMMIAFHLNPIFLETKIWLLSGTLLYVMAFAISLGPIPWLMIAEIFPTHLRGLGASFSTFFNWGSNWLVAVTFLSCVNVLGKVNTFGIYFVACIVSLLFIFYCVPETKKCSLEELECNVISGKSMRELGV